MIKYSHLAIKKVNMSTKAIIRFAKREPGISFSERPKKPETYQIYRHYDGFPAYLGVELAKFLEDTDEYVITRVPINLIKYLENQKFSSKIILESETTKLWVDFVYYIWVKPGCEEFWVSIFEGKTCLFVGKPDKLRSKYELM